MSAADPNRPVALHSFMLENRTDYVLSRGDRLRIFGAVFAVILLIAAVGYWVFDMPLWVAIVGALVGVFVNGLITLVEKH